MKAYDKALELDPNFVMAWIGKGIALGGQGKHDQAILAFDKALFYDQKKYNEAIEAFDKAIELDPYFAMTWNNKGTALFFLGKYDEAIKAYDKALELDPDFVMAWVGKGTALGGQGKHDQAILAFDKALELNPNDAFAWFNKGSSLNNLGKYAESMQAYDKAKGLDPKFAISMGKVPFDERNLNENFVPGIGKTLMATGYFSNVSTHFNIDHTIDMWVMPNHESEATLDQHLTAILTTYAMTSRNVEGVRDLTIYSGDQETSLGSWTCKRELIDFWPTSLTTPGGVMESSDVLAASTIVTEVKKTTKPEIIGVMPTFTSLKSVINQSTFNETDTTQSSLKPSKLPETY
ncbi:MAG: tetratricopeptide repeat protein [Methanotrichaceae archaeon]|nr:tetratricopeptide repeat protein [Methanotrichaceae archaeon]